MGNLKGTKLYSIFKMKCPFCHEGAFFVSHPYDLRHAGELHKECAVCHRRYEKEPGFYWGAMFVSYVFSISFSLITLGIIWLLLPDLDYIWYAVSVVGLTILASPYLYALSKITWANIFLHFDGGAARP